MMNKKVQAAVKALSGRQKLLSGAKERVVVYKEDLSTLIEWAEEQAGTRKKGFAVGDKVVTKLAIFGVPAGTPGFVHRVCQPQEGRDFIFAYEEQGLVYTLVVDAAEIKKVEEEE